MATASAATAINISKRGHHRRCQNHTNPNANTPKLKCAERAGLRHSTMTAKNVATAAQAQRWRAGQTGASAQCAAKALAKAISTPLLMLRLPS